MTIQHHAAAFAELRTLAVFLTALCVSTGAAAQPPAPSRPGVQVKVTQPSQRLEMIANSSRILKLDYRVPRLMVDDPSVVRAAPLSPDQIQVSALKAGFTQLTVWDEQGEVRTVDIIVLGDARELENLLAAEFPQATLRVRPLPNSVIVSGHVPQPDMVHRVITIAEDYYPKVINNISVSGAQEILLHVRVLEVSRSKLRKVGVDWANFNNDDAVIQNAAGLIGSYTMGTAQQVVSNRGESLAVGIINGDNAFFGFIEALRRNNLVKVMADPTLVTVSGRPASFNVGGEFPIIVPQSLGTVSIQFREFGTRVDFVPIVLGNGNVRLEVRPQVSEIDASRGVTLNNTTVPGLRTRWADTGVEMKAGQTLALAGLVQSTEESENKGIPVLSDLPWVGALFRRVQVQQNEIELLIMVTPEFADAMEAHEVPPCGPGQMTGPPSDRELYAKGYLEVPVCCDDGSCQHCQAADFGSPHDEPLQVPGVPSDPTLPPSGATRLPTRSMQSEPGRTIPATAISTAANATVPVTPDNRYFQKNSSPRTGRRPNQSRQLPPAIIGPVGYEVSK